MSRNLTINFQYGRFVAIQECRCVSEYGIVHQHSTFSGNILKTLVEVSLEEKVECGKWNLKSFQIEKVDERSDQNVMILQYYYIQLDDERYYTKISTILSSSQQETSSMTLLECHSRFLSHHN